MYEIQMSKGNNIKIDEEDLQKIIVNISASLISIKQAIINPSFMISITPTKEEEFMVKKKVVIEDGKAVLIGEEKIKKINDLMSIKGNLLKDS
jgi:hypothetical protein